MSMTVAERTVLIESIQEALAQGTLEVGEAVRRLRVEITGLHQTQFAKMCKIRYGRWCISSMEKGIRRLNR